MMNPRNSQFGTRTAHSQHAPKPAALPVHPPSATKSAALTVHPPSATKSAASPAKSVFEIHVEEWLSKQIAEETNRRRLDRLRKGLLHGTMEMLRLWHATIGNFDHLHAEWEVRGFNNKFRYIDLAYLPPGANGAIEILGYGPHARDVDVTGFKDHCLRQSVLALDGWITLQIAYPSIQDDPHLVKQLILVFIGKFLATDVAAALNWLEAESVRYARRLFRPFTAEELSAHLRISKQHTRRILRRLVELNQLKVIGGKQRYRTYQLRDPS